MIELQKVAKTYRRSANDEVPALVDVSLHIGRGEFVAIVGESGSGKSTLMNIIGLLDAPTQGRYRLDGVDVTEFNPNDQANMRNRKIGFVFQAFHLLKRYALPIVSNTGRPSSRVVNSSVSQLRELSSTSRIFFLLMNRPAI